MTRIGCNATLTTARELSSIASGHSGDLAPVAMTRQKVVERAREILVRCVSGGNRQSDRLKRIQRFLRPARVQLFMMPLKPSGHRYAWERGRSIDRRYIETFLLDNRALIRGRCLEVGDAQYTRYFGGNEVQVADVLDIHPTNQSATVIGDLEDLSSVADDSYDCVIVTQVFQYIQDPSAAVREIRRVLAPGGSAFVTMPTMAPTDPVSRDVQRFMPLGVESLFSEHFGAANTLVTTYGNMLTGLGYWAGLAQEDLPKRAWQLDDPVYPVIVAVRATSPHD